MTREPTFESYESLMRRDVPKTSRRKFSRPWSLKPPKCPVCQKYLHPDHHDRRICSVGEKEE